MTFECSGYTFLSDFDSANLAKVELAPKKSNSSGTTGKNSPAEEVPDFEFRLWTKPDCAGTEYENGNRTWFYFGIKGGVPHALVRLNVVNLNRQTKMYSQGMAPVFRIVPGHAIWERIKEKPTFMVENEDFVLSFKFRTPENMQAITYFAFTYPYSYKDLQDYLDVLDKRFTSVHGESCHSADEIYFHRECVCYSLEGRRVDLITISSHHNMTLERETRLKHLFPVHDVPRSFQFEDKKVIFISARVHPGETPSSFVLNGLLNMLLSHDDPIAAVLRKMYVFKFIPMLNPDGVAKGHYRTDTRGVNLNRVYQAPSLQLHPSIYSAWSLIKYYHFGKESYENHDVESKKTEGNACSQTLNNAPSADFQVQDAKIESAQLNHDNNRMFVIEGKVSGLTLEEKQGINIVSESKLTQNDSNEERIDCAQTIVAEKSTLDTICDTVVQNIFTKCDLPGSSIKQRLSVLKDLPGTCFLSRKHQKETRNFSGGYLNCALRNCITDAVHCDPHSEDSREHSEMLKSQQKFTWSGSSIRNKKPTFISESSGLFLYIDLHGHASKKGIFMYGNYFPNPEEKIECMLLPKIISLNSQNFHFPACNFTERNMYLRDKRDGLSREGSGRVAVWKATGLIRSYTLECNYNTGRLVNSLPPCVKDSRNYFQNTLTVPPKYTPQIFEEVGRALGVSILDLTGLNPWSRIPHSEFHTVAGIREWLRANCVAEQSCLPKVYSQLHSRHTSTTNVQGCKCRRESGRCMAGKRNNLCKPSPRTSQWDVPAGRGRKAGCRNCLQNGGVPGVSIVASSGTVPVSKLHHSSMRRNGGFSRRRRLVPVATRTGDSKIHFTKMTPNLNIGALYHSGVKGAKAEVKNLPISERKENVSNMHGSDSQSTLSKKAFPRPKENIGPSAVQIYPGISKKLKTLPTCTNVLKRVLTVQSKYTSVDSSSLCSKTSNKTISVQRLQVNPSLGRTKKVKKGLSASRAVGSNIEKCHSPAIYALNSELANEQHNSLASRIAGCKVNNPLDEPCSSGIKNTKEIKELSNPNVLYPDPKRLKITPLKFNKMSAAKRNLNKDEMLTVRKSTSKGQSKELSRQKCIIPSGAISAELDKPHSAPKTQEAIIKADSKDSLFYQSLNRNKIKKPGNSSAVNSFLASSLQNGSSEKAKQPAHLTPLEEHHNQ